MKKLLLIMFSLLLSFFLFHNVATAGPAAPSPYCQIIGNVLSLEKKTQLSSLDPTFRAEYYALKLNISDISTFQQEGDRLCDNNYLTAINNSGLILRSNEYDKNPIALGQKIKAVIHFGGDEFFGGYFLSNVEVLDTQIVNQNTNTDQLQNFNINDAVFEPKIDEGWNMSRVSIYLLVIVAAFLAVCIFVFIKLLRK